jgi:hypothetical protein
MKLVHSILNHVSIESYKTIEKRSITPKTIGKPKTTKSTTEAVF